MSLIRLDPYLRFWSILFSQKVIDSKNLLPPVKVYFFVKFTTVVLPAVSPQRGLTVKWFTQQKETPCDRGRRRECFSLPLFWCISFAEEGVPKYFFKNGYFLLLTSRILWRIVVDLRSESKDRRHFGFTGDHRFTKLTPIVAVPRKFGTDASNDPRNAGIPSLVHTALSTKGRWTSKQIWEIKTLFGEGNYSGQQHPSVRGAFSSVFGVLRSPCGFLRTSKTIPKKTLA